jgi:hypothetical protein
MTVDDNMNEDESGKIHNCSWLAYHASHVITQTHLSDLSVMLPMFRDAAHSPAMICHTLTIIKTAVQFLNPGQIPVVIFDQPLYTLAKQIQRNWPERFGENHYFCVHSWWFAYSNGCPENSRRRVRE